MKASTDNRELKKTLTISSKTFLLCVATKTEISQLKIISSIIYPNRSVLCYKNKQTRKLDTLANILISERTKEQNRYQTP